MTTIECDQPAVNRIQEVFRELPRKGCVKASVTLSSLGDILDAMEAVGFFGLMINAASSDCKTLRITAYKGKKGPCYDGGHHATLKGPARVVMDDDNHLIFGKIAVCEKTGNIYRLPMYAPFIHVSEGTTELLNRLENDPVVFDCDTFQADVDRLSAFDAWHAISDHEHQCVMYRGPFKVILCDDGSIIRRGQPVHLSTQVVAAFSPYDSFLHLPDNQVEASIAPLFSQEYAKTGSLCLLGGELQICPRTEKPSLVLPALLTCSDPMKIRVLGMIEREDTHFILTGSNPADEFGCCPSVDVGEAERLVDAGILEAFRVPAPAESCASTVYAFRDELTITDNQPIFERASEFRETVKHTLYSAQKKSPDNALKAIIKNVLLIFLAISLGSASAKAIMTISSPVTVPGETRTFTEHLGLADGVTLLLIRQEDECKSCRTAQRLCREVLEEDLQEDVLAGRVRLVQARLDDKRLLPLLETYGMADTVSIAVIDVKNSEELSLTNLTPQFWEVIIEADTFKQILSNEVRSKLRMAKP